MKRFVLAVLGAGLVAACGGGGGDKSPPPPSGALHLVNGSSFLLDEVYVAASSDPSWGSSRGVIASGSTMTVGGLAAGLWDVMIVSNGTYSPYYSFAADVNILANQTTQLVADDTVFTGSMKVVNGNASYSLTGLYVVLSPNGGSWGPNQISSPLAPSGGFVTLVRMPSDTFDVQCVWAGRTPSSTIGTGYVVSSHALTTVTCY